MGVSPTTVILAPGACEGGVRMAVHDTGSARSVRSARSARSCTVFRELWGLHGAFLGVNMRLKQNKALCFHNMPLLRQKLSKNVKPGVSRQVLRAPRAPRSASGVPRAPQWSAPGVPRALQRRSRSSHGGAEALPRAQDIIIWTNSRSTAPAAVACNRMLV